MAAFMLLGIPLFLFLQINQRLAEMNPVALALQNHSVVPDVIDVAPSNSITVYRGYVNFLFWNAKFIVTADSLPERSQRRIGE